MKIYKALSLVSLSAVLMISCTKSGVKPSASTNPQATQQAQDSVVAYRPDNSGAMGAAVPDPALAGNWILVSDSTSHTGGERPEFDSGAKYTGQPGDYFNVTNDGKINFKEGSNYQAIDCVETNSANNSFELLYSQYPNVGIAGGGYVHAQLLSLVVSANSATLTSQMIGTMGFYSRQFVLKR